MIRNIKTYVHEQVSEACVIQIFGVGPKYQKQGIASKHVQALLDKCRSKKIKLVRVLIDEHDSELQGFFKRLGFDRDRYIDFSKTVLRLFENQRVNKKFWLAMCS